MRGPLSACSGSIPRAWQRAWPSGSTGTRSANTSRPTPAAWASSHSALARPPSVGSCMAVTPPARAAASASGTMEIPGVCSRRRARSNSPAGRCPRRGANSAARMLQASSGMPLLSASRSPGRAPRGVISSAGATSPSMVPARTGRSSPAVISVWPPIRSTPSSWQAWAIWSMICCASGRSARPAGSSTVAMNQRGAAPLVATSLALTCTAYQPMSWAVKVMGSLAATSRRSPKSSTAQSKPVPGPRIRRLPGGGRRASRRSKSWAGNLPTG